MYRTSINDLYMTVVAEIIWLKAEYIEVNQNNEDFSVFITFWRLILMCSIRTSNDIVGL